MAIVNRTLDPSEQKLEFTFESGLTGTGLTLLLANVPWNASIAKIAVSAVGLSGSPTVAFAINRFIAGTGFTTITGGATTITVTAYGTSGLIYPGLAPSGSSLLQVLAGDVIVASTATANTAASGYNISIVLQGIQDIKTHFGA